MSLISDTDYLIHQIRLSYLKDVEDPYGSRIISLDPSYQTNPYIVAAGLADQERWQELAAPHSPDLTDDENENASGFPGARLKYTQTIMGGKSGAMGMRVHGKRASTSKRVSHIQAAKEAAEQNVKNFVSNGNLVQAKEALSTSAPTAAIGKSLAGESSWAKVDGEDKGKLSVSPAPNVQVQVPTAPAEAPVQKVVQFVPKFTAETEARRRMRIQARRGPVAAPQVPAKPLSWDTSSEEEEDAGAEEDDEVEINIDSDTSSDGFGSGGETMDEGDEFDPEFAATRTDNISDSAFSILSGMSSMPMTDSVPHASYRPRAARLSPVTERRARSRSRPPELTLDNQTTKSENELSAQHKKSNSSMSRSKSDAPAPSSNELSFSRKKLAPVKPVKSALSSMLASTGESTNPFAELYAAISGRGESGTTTVHVFFPSATRPAGKPMELSVRKDATIEEVIGYALYTYWEEDWEPKLGAGMSAEDPKRDQVLSAVGWIMRIAEDDGEVDDDFPPPDRMGKVAKFNADAYAVLEATPTQVQQNEALESKIQRRPSRMLKSKKSEKPTVAAGTLGATSTIQGAGSPYIGSSLGSVGLSTSLGPSFAHGPQIFLRIRVEDSADPVHVMTTIPVSAGMYMQEALEMVCRRRKLANPQDYVLLLKVEKAEKTGIMVPLDRTVASLQGNRELFLVKRNMLNTLNLKIMKETKTTDPNASIFKGISDTPEQQISSALDWTNSYKKYTIYRKMPMLVTRQERTLAIDGVYIHIMPSANKAKNVFDHGKTSSYHIKSIADCQQSAKSSAFKLILNRGTRTKRYDFEAENPKIAAEIVAKIRGLISALHRSGTVMKSRRSRQVT